MKESLSPGQSDRNSHQLINSLIEKNILSMEKELTLCKYLPWVYHFISLSNLLTAAAAAKSLQSCLTLCDPIDSSPPGSPIPGILQARALEWVAISFSNVWKWKVKVKSLSRVRLLATPWTAAYQAPPSMGFSPTNIWTHTNTKHLHTWACIPMYTV